MGGEGYCYGYEEYTNVCVNSCETQLDCPMPLLEECVEDPDHVKFCRPTTEFGY